MATSRFNKFLEDIDEKVLECVICSKRLQNPKSLNCLHSFCLTCLEDWVKKTGKLTCPTCSKSYPIPEGGVQVLPPNTFLNNLLETFHQYATPEDQIMKCVCEKTAENYCQVCRHYLCSSCTDNHKLLPILANHKLHTVEDVHSMTPQDFALLNPPLCSLHTKQLEFYCQNCKTPICMNCTFTVHRSWEGNHETISISEAFQIFKETSATLEEAANDYVNKLQDGLKAVTENTRILKQYRDTSLRDIDNLVQDVIQTVMENGNKMKRKVEAVYEKKKKVNDEQVDEIRTIISDVNTKVCSLNQLLNNDEATAMQSSEPVITALKDRINGMPKTEPEDDGQIFFITNKRHIASLQQCDIGEVETKTKTKTKVVESLTLKRKASASQGQYSLAKVIKTDECDVDENQPASTCTHPAGETNITEVEEDENYRGYIVSRKCKSSGINRLMSADDEPINQSLMVAAKVEKKGLVKTIKVIKKFTVGDYISLVKCEDGSLLVSCRTNEMYKYKQSGEYMGKVTLPQGVEIFKMCKMKNGNIAVSDEGNKCIKIVKMNGEVIKSIGQGVLGDPAGIHVDEASNVVYVADWDNDCVLMFDIENGLMTGKIDSQGKTKLEVLDVTLTNKGHLLALVCRPDEKILKLFDNEGGFLKDLLRTGSAIERGGIVIDKDDNIILSSEHKLLLFSSDGSFIKRIDKAEDGINNPQGLSIISYYPRRFAVANYGDNSIKIYNY
ncbi:tripartite motif-containing protein 2-like [Anneissia japonica]|uniref:tripartite motif-containing protein 2-like n=1 Tax=Anneissia japonica TaxID=1529436 RepID=UPI0014254D96|nr:tripartite motif-containing protein 2-like [Anneissia japonica]